MKVSSPLAYLLVLATATLFSTGGAAIKLADLSSWQIGGLRSGIAAVVLFAAVPAARRRWTGRMLLVGVAYAAVMLLFVHANKLTTAASTIFLQATAPLYVVLLGPLVLREPLRRRDLLFLVTLALGLSFFFVEIEAPTTTSPDPVRGNLLAAAAGLAYACTIVGLRGMERSSRAGGGEGVAAVVCGNAMAFAIALPFCFPFAAVELADVAVVAYLGVFQVAVAYLLLTVAVRHVTALETSVLLLLEPVLSPLWAWLVHGERPGSWALAGGALILGVTLLKTWVEGRLEARRRRLAAPEPADGRRSDAAVAPRGGEGGERLDGV